MKKNLFLSGLTLVLFSTVSSLYCGRIEVANATPNPIRVGLYEREGKPRCTEKSIQLLLQPGKKSSIGILGIVPVPGRPSKPLPHLNCCVRRVEIDGKTIWKGKGRLSMKCKGKLIIKKVGPTIVGFWE